MSAFILATFNISMALAALGVESLFQAAKLVPSERHAQIVEASISLNYTAILNIVFLAMAGLLVTRFLKTGSPEMLRMMR